MWSKENEIEQQLVPLFSSFRLKDDRLSDWIRSGLKEAHKDEIAYRATTVQELDERERQLGRRLDTLYEDRLDGRISVELYDRKFKDYSVEQEKLTEARNRQAESSLRFYELGVTMYDLSQRAEEIDLGATTTDKKRELLSLMFDRLTIESSKVSYEYSPAFKAIIGAVEATNRSKEAVTEAIAAKNFEQADINRKDRSISKNSLSWRRGRDSNS